MRHRVNVKKLSKTPAHRRAMIRNMLVALYRYEQIKTSFAKSKVLRSFAEKLITRAKKDTVHNRRMVSKWVQDKEVLNKLFTEIAVRFQTRNGGYTRTVKIGPRYGDASEMVYISLIPEDENETTQGKKTKAKPKTSSHKKSTSQKEKTNKVTGKEANQKTSKEADKEIVSSQTAELAKTTEEDQNSDSSVHSSEADVEHATKQSSEQEVEDKDQNAEIPAQEEPATPIEASNTNTEKES